MSLKLIKKGFTVVELVIVIAAVAVLAAVLIPTFSNLIYEANYSADTQMVTNLNKHLALAEISDGKNETMYEALQDAEKAGYTVGAFLSTENKILWNQETDRFIAVNKKNKIFSQDEKVNNTKLTGSKVTDYKYWRIYNENNPIPEISEQLYSIYWAGTESPTGEESVNNKPISLRVSVGYDCGDYENANLVTIVYTSLDNIKIRLHRGHLAISTVGALNVYSYGELDTLCYDIKVKSDNVTNKGNLYLNNTSFVANLGTDNEGNLISKGAKFHQLQSEIESELCEFDDETLFGQHYPNEENCVFCKNTEIPEYIHTIETTFKNATCTEEGSISIKCKNCDYEVKIETIQPFGHSYTSADNGIDPTCTRAGQTSGEICIRCFDRKTGSLLSPLGHDFVGGSCNRCHITDGEVSSATISMRDGKLYIAESSLEGFNRMTDTFVIKLEEDVTTTSIEFRNLLGDNKKLVGYDENGNPIAYSLGEGNFELCYVEIYLNGHTLTVNNDNNEVGLTLNGKLSVIGDETNNSKLVLNGMTSYTSVIVLSDKDSEVEFNNVNCNSDWAPIFVSYSSNKVSINNSKLLMTKTSEATSGFVYYTVTPWWSDGDTCINFNNYYHTLINSISSTIKYNQTIIETNVIKKLLNMIVEADSNYKAVTYFVKGLDGNYYYIDKQSLYGCNQITNNNIKIANNDFISNMKKLCIEKTTNGVTYYEYSWGAQSKPLMGVEPNNGNGSYYKIYKDSDDNYYLRCYFNEPVTINKNMNHLGWAIADAAISEAEKTKFNDSAFTTSTVSFVEDGE